MKYLSLTGTMLNWFNVVTHYFILNLYTEVINYMLLLMHYKLQLFTAREIDFGNSVKL